MGGYRAFPAGSVYFDAFRDLSDGTSAADSDAFAEARVLCG